MAILQEYSIGVSNVNPNRLGNWSLILIELQCNPFSTWEQLFYIVFVVVQTHKLYNFKTIIYEFFLHQK